MKTNYFLFPKRTLKILSFILLTLSYSRLTGQSHILKFECPVYECNIYGENVSQDFIVAPRGSKLDSIRLNKDGDIIITFLKWTLPKKDTSHLAFMKPEEIAFIKSQVHKINTFNKQISSVNLKSQFLEAKNFLAHADSTKYFVIKKEDFQTLVIRYVKMSQRFSFTGGVVTIPFKLRDKPFDFSKDITLAGSGAFGYNFSDNVAIYLIGSLGISSISIDSLNTSGKTMKPSNLSAFTISPGIICSLYKFQISLNYGWDFLGNADSDKGWIYNKKGWFGLGLGYQLFVPNHQQVDKIKETEDQN